MFAGLEPDVAEENIQARVRGGVLMALSNKFGALLLTTGNKSEIAVGYCTLYGDMAGGLAVISDVPKTFVYRLAALHQRDAAPQPVIPAVDDHQGARAPSCGRTRPIRTACRPTTCSIASSRPTSNAISTSTASPRSAWIATIAVRVVSLIDRNEYKRRQAAPGLKITSKAFGVGRRYPIAADYGEMTRARAAAAPVSEVRAGTPEP